MEKSLDIGDTEIRHIPSFEGIYSPVRKIDYVITRSYAKYCNTSQIFNVLVEDTFGKFFQD